MKVLVLGASGIVGQHMRLCIPPGVEPTWVRRTPDLITLGCDLTDAFTLQALLAKHDPDMIVNLAGESNVDFVEREPSPRTYPINVGLPRMLAEWCSDSDRRLVHVSSQAVYGHYGHHCNTYARHKFTAEAYSAPHTIVRLTFILGIRPLPHVGRENPLEAMLRGQSPQVNDRWFSPLFAWDAAELLWDAVMTGKPGEIRECGIPERWSRYDIARLAINHLPQWLKDKRPVIPCSHDDFPGLAPRPIDTTYTGSRYRNPMNQKTMLECVALASLDRQIELALFFGITLEAASARLARGFHGLHEHVTEEWNQAVAANSMSEFRAPQTQVEILDFYRTTEAYIWELSAYHEDAGFNYAGMCAGIAQCLQSNGCVRVLCLGDGIGDLTLAMERSGLFPVYHDLARSRTAAYAAFRFWRQTGNNIQTDMQAYISGFQPDFRDGYDAVIALDFLEHLPNLTEWLKEIYTALVPGGLMMARNAFGKGSGPEGAMPMHLSVNDPYEDVAEWEKLCRAAGFELYDPSTPDWWRK